MLATIHNTLVLSHGEKVGCVLLFVLLFILASQCTDDDDPTWMRVMGTVGVFLVPLLAIFWIIIVK